MKITREADYAIRILYIIKSETGVISAREISEKAGVSALRLFTRRLPSFLNVQSGQTDGQPHLIDHIVLVAEVLILTFYATVLRILLEKSTCLPFRAVLKV